MINNIEKELDKIFKNVGCELIYNNNPFYLLIAVMLSAQTTDKKVNSVTPTLFSLYPTVLELSKADENKVEQILRPLGISKIKAKRVIEISKILHEKFHDEVPSSKEELMTLPGVGNKTASVIRVEYFKIPEFPVDTHVHRVSKRLGIINENDGVEECEEKLKKMYPSTSWGKLHHQFIHFGREICHSRSPKCSICPFSKECHFSK